MIKKFRLCFEGDSAIITILLGLNSTSGVSMGRASCVKAHVVQHATTRHDRMMNFMKHMILSAF